MQGWDNFTNGLVKGWADFSSGFMSDMDRFGSWLGSVWQGLIDGIVADWQGLVDGAMAIWTETKLKFADVVESFKEMGRNITEGFQNGIAEFTDDPMGWLKEHVFDPFINAFKTLFGIHSPSAVFTELGGYITAGLLNGVLNGMKNIGSWIMSNVFSPFINGFKAAFGIASPSRKMLEQGLYLIDGLKNGLSERVPIVYDFFKSSCTKVKEIFGGFSWRSIGSNICDGIGSGINEGWSWLRNKASSVAKSLLDAAKSALGIHSPSRVFRDEVGKNIGYGIGEGIEASEGSIMGSVRSVAGAIADEFQSNEYSIAPIGADIDGNFVRTLDNVSDTIANSFSSLMDQLQAIADRVTFTVPVTASSVVPYANKTDTRPPEGDRAYNGGDDMADIIIDAILQGCEAIVKAINEKPTGATIGDDAIFAAYNRHSDKISIVKG